MTEFFQKKIKKNCRLVLKMTKYLIEEWCRTHINNTLLKIIIDSHNESKILGRWPLFEYLQNNYEFSFSVYCAVFDKLNIKFPGCMVVAGGAIYNKNSKDIDIFFYNVTNEKMMEIIEYFDKTYQTIGNKNKIFCYRNNNAVTFKKNIEEYDPSDFYNYHNQNQKDIQFITKIYNSKDQIIGNFDIGPSMIMYDGKRFLTNILGLYCFITKSNLIGKHEESNDFKYRCFKYYTRGYDPYIPTYLSGGLNYAEIYKKAYTEEGYCPEYGIIELCKKVDSWTSSIDSKNITIDYNVPVYSLEYKDLYENYSYICPDNKDLHHLSPKSKQTFDLIYKNRLNNVINIEIIPRKDTLYISPLRILLDTYLSTDVINMIYDYSNLDIDIDYLREYPIKGIEKNGLLFLEYFKKYLHQ